MNFQSCERDVVGEGVGLSKDTYNNDNIMRLSWALVDSRHSTIIQRGITMLEGR